MKPVKFFLPKISRAKQEPTYRAIIDSMEDQLNLSVNDRRIFQLDYTLDKKNYSATVGEIEQMNNNHEIVAILEAKVYIIFARVLGSEHGLTILVNPDDVREIVEFQTV